MVFMCADVGFATHHSHEHRSQYLCGIAGIYFITPFSPPPSSFWFSSSFWAHLFYAHLRGAHVKLRIKETAPLKLQYLFYSEDCILELYFSCNRNCHGELGCISRSLSFAQLHNKQLSYFTRFKQTTFKIRSITCPCLSSKTLYPTEKGRDIDIDRYR